MYGHIKVCALLTVLFDPFLQILFVDVPQNFKKIVLFLEHGFMYLNLFKKLKNVQKTDSTYPLTRKVSNNVYCPSLGKEQVIDQQERLYYLFTPKVSTQSILRH